MGGGVGGGVAKESGRAPHYMSKCPPVYVQGALTGSSPFTHNIQDPIRACGKCAALCACVRACVHVGVCAWACVRVITSFV